MITQTVQCNFLVSHKVRSCSRGWSVSEINKENGKKLQIPFNIDYVERSTTRHGALEPCIAAQGAICNFNTRCVYWNENRRFYTWKIASGFWHLRPGRRFFFLSPWGSLLLFFKWKPVLPDYPMSLLVQRISRIQSLACNPCPRHLQVNSQAHILFQLLVLYLQFVLCVAMDSLYEFTLFKKSYQDMFTCL